MTDKPTPTPMELLTKVGSFRTYNDNRVSDSIQFKRLYAVITELEGERDMLQNGIDLEIEELRTDLTTAQALLKKKPDEEATHDTD